jgi:DNA processing protein
MLLSIIISKMKIYRLKPNQESFPENLKQIPYSPKSIYVVGDASILSYEPLISMVGSRKVTSYGRLVTEKLASELAGQGIVTVSGLALGVDSICHRASIRAGGKTIAVLPCGLDRVYPTSHQNLAQEIVETGGALISEYPEGTPPLRQHFIARNRLVSGISDALIITESAIKSGTLHTAKFALEQNKVVMAVPGNINSTNSEGTNNLIKTGAIPVTKNQDVLEAIGYTFKSKLSDRTLTANTPEEYLILSLIQKGSRDIEELLDFSNLSPSLFNQTLTMLELSGRIKSAGAGKWDLNT